MAAWTVMTRGVAQAPAFADSNNGHDARATRADREAGRLSSVRPTGRTLRTGRPAHRAANAGKDRHQSDRIRCAPINANSVVAGSSRPSSACPRRWDLPISRAPRSYLTYPAVAPCRNLGKTTFVESAAERLRLCQSVYQFGEFDTPSVADSRNFRRTRRHLGHFVKSQPAHGHPD